MAKLLRSRQIFYSRLLWVDFPGVQVKDDRAALFVDFSHAKTRVGVRKQPEIAATVERKTTPVHLQHAHRKFVQLIGNFVGTQRCVGDAVVGMKTERED